MIEKWRYSHKCIKSQIVAHTDLNDSKDHVNDCKVKTLTQTHKVTHKDSNDIVEHVMKIL